jgi:hypothetical protein
MSDWRQFNLMNFLDFYFMLMFFVGTYRRLSQYRNIVRLAFGGPGRWPKLLRLIHDHYAVFLTWTTLLPLALGLVLTIVQFIASRVVWPDAGKPPLGMTLGLLVHHWLALIVVAPLAVAMFGVDLYFLVRVGSFDRSQLEKYFDQAEYWLNSPTAHFVRAFTFGVINPRRMVAEEVRKALVAAGNLLNTSLWWWNVQIALRFFFGLSLWLTWAFSGGI